MSVSTESEQSAGQGYPPTWALRAHGIPVSLSMDTSVWWSGDVPETTILDNPYTYTEDHSGRTHGQ